jgi:hypothetical protein
MRKAATLCLLVSGAGLLSACGAGGSLFNRVRPDEFAVTRQAPLVVPPDFALTPPNPGAPRPQDVDPASRRWKRCSAARPRAARWKPT